MSSLSLGDDSLSGSKKEQDSAKDKNLKPSSGKQVNDSIGGVDIERATNVQSLELDDEINSILNNSEENSKVQTKERTDTKNEDDIATQMNLPDLQDLDIGPLDKIQNPMNKIVLDFDDTSKTVSNSQSPNPIDEETYDRYKNSSSQADIRRNLSLVPITSEAALGSSNHEDEKDSSKISAYARLDFENFTFFVQTLQVILGRKSNDELLQSSHHAVDVHLSSTKAISRRHAKIFYNFGTQRFELSILGRNGAFVDDAFTEKGITVPLADGTKIQIGDITFAFVLPSIDSNTNDNSAGADKQFNPSDAINLRSNLYKVSESPSKNDQKPNKSLESDKPRKESKPSILASPSNSNSDIPSRTSRSGSQSKSDGPRRLSSTRKKSVTNDEIDDILNELGTNSISAIDEEESDLLDSEIQSILNDPENHGQDGEMDLDEENLLKLTQFNEASNEEDEIDKLVQQHNLEQGVTWDEDELDRDEENENENEMHDIDLDLSVLDQEIATLAPLIDAHHQDLMKEKEEKRKQLEQEKRKKELQQLRKMAGKKLPLNKPKTKPNTGSIPQPPTRSTPLMGKPAVPRMGRPASIQPPASRLYGRQTPTNGLSKAQLVDNRLTTMSSPLAGLPTHLVAQGSANSGLPLKIAQGTHHSMAHLVNSQMSKPLMPPKPPAPKLDVQLQTITSTTSTPVRIPIRAITINSKIELPPVCVPKNLSEQKDTPKVPKRRKDISQIKKAAKSIYTIDEIPEHYRIKPTLSYPLMVTNVLKSKGGELGLTLSEINESIKDIYPYYKYCPDGWQTSVSHNVTLNKIFKRISKKDYDAGWTWGIDDAYIAEREKVKQKQQEMAAAKAKAAAIKAEELKQKQRLEAQQGATHNIVGRNFASPYGLSPLNTGLRMPQSQFISQLQQKQMSSASTNGQKPKTIAELASEIRRDGLIGSKAPLYFKPQSTLQVNSSGELVKRNDIPATVSSPATSTVSPQPPTSTNTIKAQLAANRSQSPPLLSPVSQGTQPLHEEKPKMNQDTKKSLAYLQKELFTLYKARKLSYNTATTTEVITKALATTIAQVNIIGVKAGCGDNALSFLVEKAPQQVSKILDIALTKSIKEKQGTLSSRPASRGGTPGPTSQSLASSPEKQTPSLVNTPQLAGSPKASSLSTLPIDKSKEQHTLSSHRPELATHSNSKETNPNVSKEFSNDSKPNYLSDIKSESPSASPSLARPPVYKSGLSKPPTFFGKSESSSPSQSTFTSASYSSGAGLPKPQSFSKPSALSNPPQFLSNKPARPSFHGNKDETAVPRPPSFTSGSFPPTKSQNNSTATANSPNLREKTTGESAEQTTVSNASGTKRSASDEDKVEEKLEDNSRKIIKIE
ncbi:uncharacterized protein AC631_01622 [Debaryomyces fabryi]|uniref:FHA domain-containing protein n=1 Tax=Debaryomyces fabryi TaxID=58627 RepID=A0A0V1Q281_9ASCO|nr:uncharacterized protein AC631_01622 [Debaryomyces fabryi]KSA02635.1 hypothetical protein AC631_01622 [Debaryomyces fabryi]